MEEHSNLCSLLDESIGSLDGGLDACLTKLANFVEKHAEGEIARQACNDLDLPDDIEDMYTVVLCVRLATALQPDSTAEPYQFCKV